MSDALLLQLEIDRFNAAKREITGELGAHPGVGVDRVDCEPAVPDAGLDGAERRHHRGGDPQAAQAGGRQGRGASQGARSRLDQ